MSQDGNGQSRSDEATTQTASILIGGVSIKLLTSSYPHLIESYKSRAFSTAIEVEHLKQTLLERELREDAAGSCRSKALEKTIEVEHLKEVLLEKTLRVVSAGS